MILQVSDSELELMKIVWASGGSTLYAQIMEELGKAGRDWQKNTVITLLSRLVEKGLLKTSKLGRRNRYTALVSEGERGRGITRRPRPKPFSISSTQGMPGDW